MTCAEFQKVLPEIFEKHGDLDDQEHLRTCKDCSSLVADLKYIAEQARLLLPMHDPNPRVWQNIEASLRKEPVAPENRTRGQAGSKKS